MPWGDSCAKCAACNILRHNGVPLGKADYVQHMFAYLRK
ncbi:hypothetical protein BW33_02961 [Pseudomonas sp. RIT288]|nr:hypothetical protein BW33_02961 [Pseudomonas sp. RIT288]